MKKLTHNHNGFSLLELLLVVGVMSVLLTGIAVAYNNWFLDSIDRKVARQMKSLQSSAEGYVNLNFQTVHTSLVPNLGNIAEIPISSLIAQDFLPTGYSAQNAYRQNLRIFIRNVDNDPVRPVIEVLTLSDNVGASVRRIEDQRLVNAAINGGPTVGIISSLAVNATCCNGNIQSIQGTWSVLLSDFNTLYTSTPNANGGYMAAYGRVSNDSSTVDNYLFRQRVTGAPQLNRMNTNLDMNNNNIVNAGAIVVDSTDIGGNGTFLGIESSGLASPYVLSVRDNFNAGQNVNVTRNGDEKGEVIIPGDNTVGVDFTVTNTMNVFLDNVPNQGQVSSDNFVATNLVVGNDANFNTVNMNGTALNGNNLYSRSIEYGQDITTQTLQAASANNLNSISADYAVTKTTHVTTTDLNVPNDLSVDNSMALNSNTRATGPMLGTNIVTIKTMNSCGSGCP